MYLLSDTNVAGNSVFSSGFGLGRDNQRLVAVGPTCTVRFGTHEELLLPVKASALSERK